MATDEPDTYLAILKASYDYQPQSQDELAIAENQLLLLVERIDDEWWKVKIKTSSQESDTPVGLVPAAYVEQAEHTSTVKALYDYEASAPGELSIHEGDVLLVFDTEEDWILVQNSKEEGKAGYVPGNYVEVIDDEESAAAPAPSRIIVPDSPPPPTSSYVDPADRVASAKVTADDIQTWSVSEIDKKGKKKKGTLGIGNGAVFFASEADKTPVQKWQTQDVSSVTTEKSKHVRIDIGGPTPISLHFHAGSKENADGIVLKLNSSKAISSASAPEQEQQLPDNPQPSSDTTLPKKASVHFSSASPVIIPTPDDDDDEGEEEEEAEEKEEHAESYTGTSLNASLTAVALYDFKADGDDELSVAEGEHLTVLEKDGDEWWKCRNASGSEGVVPASYLEVVSGASDSHQTEQIRDREAEEREAQELAKQREVERLRLEEEEKQRAIAARKAEAQQKAKQAAIAAEAERVKRMDAAAASRVSPPPAAQSPSTRPQEPSKGAATSSATRNSTELTRPPLDKTRIWHDRSGQFRVEAAFLGFNNGKLRLHKVNGVIVEVPSEKMSLDDMRYVEKLLDKKQRPSTAPRVSEDDIPLAISKVATKSEKVTPKKAPQIDWFDFFLSAGCDLDDCTRYAASFERDKIDETLLADITEGTMRSLGLREGDIIRVKKAIEKRKSTDNLYKAGGHISEQMRRDEELARQLQAQEASSAGRASAPNLFAGPGGVLKPRRGRPQPTKSLPLSNVDIKTISSASDQIQRSSSPQTQSPASVQTPSLPPRPNSAAAGNGFDDSEAWTNRPSSTKPVKAASPVAPPRGSSVPPTVPQQPTPTTTAPAPEQTPSVRATSAAPSAPPSVQTPPSLTKTESDIFDQLARLSALRTSTSLLPQNPSPAPLNATPPVILNSGLGIGPSPVPMGQLHVAQPTLSPPLVQVPYNGPRGPFAPVPANQGLLQPLIPTRTGFNGFIPTKPVNSPSFQNQLTPGFVPQQATGFPSLQPMVGQPTGIFSNLNPTSPFETNGFGSLQSHTTGFIPSPDQTNFGNASTIASPPPLPANPSQSNNTSPANIFAQMKSGTFANDNENPSHNSVLNGQTQTWGQSYQGYTGY